MERAALTKLDLPDCPGVYLFTKGKGIGKQILYVGKATSLRDRVRSYFDDDLIATRGPRIVDMVTQADGLSHETTPTVLEALVREAALIREHLPKGNAMGKDDKTFLYAVITKEQIPRVLAVRGSDLNFKKKRITNSQPIGINWLNGRKGSEGQAYTHAYGPFPSGYQLREGLKLIRRIFPFFDTPRPVTDTGKHGRARIEFGTQIGQYPRVPVGRQVVTTEERSDYMRSIKHVSLFLSGRVKTLRKELQREMHQAAKEEEFETAALLRNQLFSLDHIQDVSLIKADRSEDPTSPRIEAYDTAHISGTNAIGVMVVIENGVPVRSDYRLFRIRGKYNDLRSRYIKKGKDDSSKYKLEYGLTKSAGRQNDDIASLKEILSRRFGHPEWAYPKAIVVDGGTTHKKAAESVLAEFGIGIPVIAVVKDEKHRPREVIGSLRAGVKDADVVLANSEAHRFAVANHRKARSRAMRTDSLRR